MSAEIEILGNCVCGQKVELEIDFIDDEIVLSIEPCKQCIDKALKGLVHNSLIAIFHSPKWLTPQEMDELRKTEIHITIEK
jgi:hypothetical protein